MTQPTNQGQQDWQDWEDIIPGGMDAPGGPEKDTADEALRSSRYSAARPVDDSELTDNPKAAGPGYQPQVEAPALPRRDPPRRIRDQMPATDVWQLGGSARPKQTQVRLPRPNVAAAVLFGLIPVALLAGGLYLVMHLYP